MCTFLFSFFFFVPLHSFNSSIPLLDEDSHPYSPHSTHPHSDSLHSHHFHPESPHSPNSHPDSHYFHLDSLHVSHSHYASPHFHHSPHPAPRFPIPAFTEDHIFLFFLIDKNLHLDFVEL